MVVVAKRWFLCGRDGGMLGCPGKILRRGSVLNDKNRDLSVLNDGMKMIWYSGLFQQKVDYCFVQRIALTQGWLLVSAAEWLTRSRWMISAARCFDQKSMDG